MSGSARMLFVKLPYTLATEEAERIGLDHVARISVVTTTEGDGGRHQAVDTLQAQHSAIKMLASRVRLVLEYVRAVERGELEHNHEIMRQVGLHLAPLLLNCTLKPVCASLSHYI